jgi:hypothetical protein
MPMPEELARKEIEALLTQCGSGLADVVSLLNSSSTF